MSTHKPYSPQATVVLGLAQLALGAIIPAITSTKLDQGSCLLNLTTGRVCDFVYSTSGFSLFFSLILLIPTLLWLRGAGKAKPTPLIIEAGHLSLFAAFWWMTLAITITIRGNQAGDAGYGEGTARNAVIAFSWIQMVFFLLNAVLVIADRAQDYWARSKSHKGDDTASNEGSERYAYTQALAHTPLS